MMFRKNSLSFFRAGFRVFWLSLFIIGLLGIVVAPSVNATSPTIKILRVEGNIVPIVADYIVRSLDQAEAEGNNIVIIELNTPGGLYDTTQKIVQRILNAKVPVVVYVSPAGGWAGSAGTFITLAANVAAMAPGSRIGAATPVSMEGQMPEEMKRKITEDAAAWARSIAEMRGRDPHYAELAVREGKSYTDSEALEKKLIDLRVDTLKDLISQLNGKKITLAPGNDIVLQTEGYVLVREEMSAIERLLHMISNPNIAYLLLSLGAIGIMAELWNPGMFFPGIFGAISLLLAFYSLGVFNASLGGILLLLLALGLFVAEMFTPTFGILTAGGTAAFILGSLILFPEEIRINPWLIAAVSSGVVAFFVFVLQAVVRSQRKKITVGGGAEGMIGKMAVVKTALNPEGTVFVHGELWQAEIEADKAEPGEEVVVTGVEGLRLIVTKRIGKGG